VDLREQIEREAAAAKRAVPLLADGPVTEALRAASDRVKSKREQILDANRLDVEAAGGLDAGTLDRMRLDDSRLAALSEQLRFMAEHEPLQRDAEGWSRAGLRIEERRIPIGVVGAVFEARPLVALDIASQLLKSLNGGVLRTGGAALRTVTVLVDEVLRPALDSTGLPPDVIGLVRTPDHEGARVLVSMPRLVPLVILRGSGETTAALARHAAEHGVRTLAHAEGGGVLYVHASASLDKLLALLRGHGLEVHGDVEDARTLDRPIGYEWATDPNPNQVTVCYLESLEEAVRIANEETSGLAAAIVAEDPVAAGRFLDAYRGTAAFWNETTRLTDGWKLTGAPETGINVDWTPGPRGPVTYRDLWLRQYRVVPDGEQ
jgi:glutamate-5-semialdehyde dehydrogenase